MQKYPRFGVISAGFIGRMHLKALQAAGLEVAALADPSKDALTAAAEWAPGATTYSDWQDLLKDPAVNAVNICTINALHFPIFEAAIASGKHVFCEKTMTISAEEAHKALAMKPASGQVVQIGYMKRFFPASQWAKDRCLLSIRGEPGDFGGSSLM